MNSQTVDKLASYVEALRSIIYIPHFDFDAVDKMISSISKDVRIDEWNGAFVKLDSKPTDTQYDLMEFLSFYDIEDTQNTFIVLKDIQSYLREPNILSKLKAIANRNIYDENYSVTIFIVSTTLFIPRELEHLITVFDIPLPKTQEIIETINSFAKELQITIPEKLINELALSLKGFSEFDIIQILNLAYQNSGSIEEKDRKLIIEEKEQIIKKSGMLEILNYKETIDDIGGLENLKKWLKNKSEIFNRLEEAVNFGVDIPNGIMIVGMPGCGKSLTAKATATLFKVPLLRLDVGKLLGKYVGESEENFRKAIKIAEAVSPCVLWIDELEKAFAGIGESGGGNEVTTRLFGFFLTWLQEKESSVFIVATSNDISKLPPEFLRKGRFDEIFFVDFPNIQERRKIFEIHIKKRNKWNRKIDSIKLMKATEGYSGADIESIVKESIELAFIENRDSISTENLLFEIKNTKPLSQTFKDKIESVKSTLDAIDIKKASVD